MTDGIETFIAARLDEDEATANAVGDERERTWTAETDGQLDAGYVQNGLGTTIVYDEGRPRAAEAAHIARHDPARVLRDITAKRAMLADLVRAAERFGGYRDDCDDPLRLHMRALAAPYADHPDFKPKWSLDA